MRLLLSSWFLTPDSRPSALPATLATGRAGIVLNALDEYGPSRTRDYARESHTLETFGYSCEELDLRDYFAAPAELPERLDALDLVWTLGGNAFVLARAMTQAGFRDALQEQLHRPEFTYGGYSAGACVAGPDLQGIDLIDDPTVLPEGYPSTTAPECLRLMPYRIVPHWRSEHRDAQGAERAAAHLAERGLPHRCLRDGETLNIQDTTTTVT
ncbi:Type 1 glutamine amidotransferase-like domain-containing protein [Streptomyces sp. W16]|uniref:Type 1 glutamine amidotransferase-like domain-containing protein n=1 Tax=Streptomyces sp. W16 TaxID=3076631 RepID=UPI00295BB7C8|nr:Type 1 glutamine amidotransferase-like domain-containing protein [Streptomyces sp. W16]MDV9172270.1 Type 1 glutamine amidotransferase-like domain-containing protein [Streptomyces sp. W16]